MNSLVATEAMLPTRMARTAASFALAWLMLSGGLLTLRTMVRATQPLSPGMLVGAAICLASVAWLARRVSRFDVPRFDRPWKSLLSVAATSAALLFWGLSLSRGVESSVAVAFFWLAIVCEEAWGWRQQMRSYQQRAVGPLLHERVVQELTRLITAEGEEVIRGSLAIQIDQGSRMAAAHVAFCPPFNERPRFDVHSRTGHEVALKVSQLYPHGARIEVKLPQPAKAGTTVAVQFVARLPHTPAHSH
jgi:hypothetical protein